MEAEKSGLRGAQRGLPRPTQSRIYAVEAVTEQARELRLLNKA